MWFYILLLKSTCLTIENDAEFILQAPKLTQLITKTTFSTKILIRALILHGIYCTGQSFNEVYCMFYQ